MSVLNRTRSAPADPATASSPQALADPPTAPAAKLMPGIRPDVAWIGVGALALIYAVVIIFMLQNTGNVEVNFLWMHRIVPLALAPMVVGVGVVAVAVMAAVARIIPLRRLYGRQHH